MYDKMHYFRVGKYLFSTAYKASVQYYFLFYLSNLKTLYKHYLYTNIIIIFFQRFNKYVTVPRNGLYFFHQHPAKLVK